MKHQMAEFNYPNISWRQILSNMILLEFLVFLEKKRKEVDQLTIEKDLIEEVEEVRTFDNGNHDCWNFYCKEN